MGILDEVHTKNNNNTATTENTAGSGSSKENSSNSYISDDQIKKWLFKKNDYFDKKVCMVLGEDGTGKSGLVIHHIAQELSKEENKDKIAIYLDLDRGAMNLLKHYPEDIRKRILIKDILYVEKNDGKVVIDYAKTMHWIRAVSNYASENYEKKGIIAFAFDGLSTLLKHAERQMRLDKNVDAAGDVKYKYWKKRNEDFEETLEIIKKIPIDSYFIGHEDFLIVENSPSIKIKTNALMFQKIYCERLPQESGVKHQATVMKSKNNPVKENNKEIFMQVKDGKVAFDSSKVFEGL